MSVRGGTIRGSTGTGVACRRVSLRVQRCIRGARARAGLAAPRWGAPTAEGTTMARSVDTESSGRSRGRRRPPRTQAADDGVFRGACRRRGGPRDAPRGPAGSRRTGEHTGAEHPASAPVTDRRPRGAHRGDRGGPGHGSSLDARPAALPQGTRGRQEGRTAVGVAGSLCCSTSASCSSCCSPDPCSISRSTLWARSTPRSASRSTSPSWRPDSRPTAPGCSGAGSWSGLIGVVLWSTINVFVTFLYNLISDVVGGIEITLGEKRSRRG